MKVGIEAGVALVAAGLLTTGQQVSADQQAPAQDAVVKTSTTTPVKTSSDQDSLTNETNDSQGADRSNQAVHADQSSTSEPVDDPDQANSSSQPDHATQSDEPTVRQQLQDVVSTQLQADASAQVVAQMQAEHDAKQKQYDQQDAQVQAQTQTYADAANQYDQAKQSFEAAQNQTQVQLQAYNERNNQYQLQADAYNARQSRAGDWQTITAQVDTYNTVSNQYTKAIENGQAELAAYKAKLSQYQQAFSAYDVKTATQAQYAQLQALAQQLAEDQGQLKGRFSSLQDFHDQLAASYTKLQAATQKVRDDVPNDSAAYSTLNAQRQALLAEATRLTAQQAQPDQNAKTAQALMATYQDLFAQQEQLEQANDQLNTAYSALSDDSMQIETAQMRAEADQEAADSAKAYAQANISEQIHEWINSLHPDNGNHPGNDTAANQGSSQSDQDAHSTSTGVANQAISIPTISPINIQTSAIVLPISLKTPVTSVDKLATFSAPTDLIVDNLLSAAILVPDAPTSPLVTTTALPATRVIKVLDETKGTTVMTLTMTQDDVQFTLPKDYHLAATQSVAAQAAGSQAQVTLQEGTNTYTVYVVKDVPAASTHSVEEQADPSDDKVTPIIKTQSASPVSVDQEGYDDARQPMVVEKSANAPAVSVTQAEYDAAQSIPDKTAQSALAVSVSAQDFYDERQPKSIEIAQSAPAVSVTSEDFYDHQPSTPSKTPAVTAGEPQSEPLQQILPKQVLSQPRIVAQKAGVSRQSLINKRQHAVSQRRLAQPLQSSRQISQLNTSTVQHEYPRTGEHRANWLSLLGMLSVTAMTTLLIKRRKA